MNIEVIGISRDLGPSQNKFKETVGAKNIFFSDVEGAVATAYGALDPARRSTRRYYFLLGENGNILWKDVSNRLIPPEQLFELLATASKSN
jgi:peroxiredoxin